MSVEIYTPKEAKDQFEKQPFRKRHPFLFIHFTMIAPAAIILHHLLH